MLAGIIKVMKIVVSENLVELARKLRRYAPLYVVGGYVRNSLMGISAGDVDLASKISPEKLENILKGSKFEVKERNKKLGTMLIRCDNELWEYSTFRKDNYDFGGKHVPKTVDFVEDIREDARRRDFTINAIYYDINKDEIIDIYSGIYDLQKRIIRTVETPSYVFENDGLRILRMIRFACELGFKIDRQTFLMAKKMAYRLRDITGTRKFQELTKILNSPTKYSVSKKDAHMTGLNLINYLGLWPLMFVHVSRVKYKMVKKVADGDRFVGLLVDIVNSINPDCIEYYLKFLLGQEAFSLNRYSIENNIKIVCGYFDALNKMQNKKYFFKYYDYFGKIKELLRLKSKFLYSKYYFFENYIKKHKLPIHIKELKINGEDIKKNFPDFPQRKYSALLYDIFDKVFDGIIPNEKQALLKEVKEYVRCHND